MSILLDAQQHLVDLDLAMYPYDESFLDFNGARLFKIFPICKCSCKLFLTYKYFTSGLN